MRILKSTKPQISFRPQRCAEKHQQNFGFHLDASLRLSKDSIKPHNLPRWKEDANRLNDYRNVMKEC